MLSLADDTLVNRTRELGDEASDGSAHPLFPEDTSAADPASMGVAVILGGWTRGGNASTNYNGAVQSQIDFLYGSGTPKTTDGAFSHRVDGLQLW